MARQLFIYFAVVGLFFASGCVNPLKDLLVTKGQKEKEIAALKTEYEGKITTAKNQVSQIKDKVIEDQHHQMRGAANAFYGQEVVFRSIVTPTRTDLIQHNLAIEGLSALKVSPTIDDMKAMNERMAAELDETRTTLADLRANHIKAVAANEALAAATEKHKQELDAANHQLAVLQTESLTEITKKQGEMIVLQDKINELEKERGDQKEALIAMKTKISTVLGILALVGLAGAIYSPVLKQQCAAFGAICGLAAIGIWFIQPWHVAVVAGAVILVVLGWIIVKHQKEERVADSLVLAAEDIKEKSADTWAQIAPVIDDRLKRYTKKGGKLVAETDHAIKKYIDQKRAEWDRL